MKSKCPDCEKEFSSKDSMMQHRRDAHQSAKEPQKKSFKPRKLLTYAIIILILLGIGGVAYWLIISSLNTPGSISSFNISFVPYEGSASAKVDIIEFGDYQCTVCSDFSINNEPQIKQNYVDNGKVRFYFADFAFLGADSKTLSEGAWCANEQNLYYAYHDYIYSNQGVENSGWATLDKVKAMAKNINGLSVTDFSACLDSNKYQSRIQQLRDVGANSGVSGTPTFFIGNNNIGYVSVVGNLPYATFQQKIDSQLAKVS